MKNFILGFVAICSLVPSKTFAQEFTGKAVYEVRTSSTVTFSNDGMNPLQVKAMNEKLNKQVVETYFLSFNKYESNFEKEQKLESVSANKSGASPFGGNDTKQYMNLKEKIQLVEEDFMGKEFLVTKPLREWNWQLTGETKKIGDYLCYKATSVQVMTEEEKIEFEQMKKEMESRSSNIMVISEPENEITTAWYTPEIPVSHGPQELWGLPGLILEASVGQSTILCSKVTLNPKDKVVIKRLKKGKKVTQVEYDKIMNDKFDSMKNREGAIEIKFGN